MIHDLETNFCPETRLRLDLLVRAVALSHGVAAGDLLAPTRRGPRIAKARQALMYLAHVLLGLSLNQVGRAFGRDRTTAAHACRVIEEQREDPGFDRRLDELECGLRSLLPQPALAKRAGAGR